MSTTVLSIDAITSNPDIRGGRPSIAGRAITVADLVARYLNGVPLEDLASNFDLTFGQVHAALAYYYTDDVHLRRATEMGRVLCTSGADFLILA